MKKRILHLLSSNSFSGAENIACTIINSLDDKYVMAYCSPNGDINKILANKNITYYPLKKLSLFEIRRVVKEFKPDVIHAHDFKASIYSSLFTRKNAVVSHIHKNDPMMKKISIKGIIYFLCMCNFSKIIVVSKSIIDESKVLRLAKNKCVILHNYIDRNAIIKKADEYVVDTAYDLFYFGRLSNEKNPLEFIEIVKKMHDKKVRAVMVGSGPLFQVCENKIREYNLENNIDLIGFKQNPYPYIKASKIGIMPSKYEGFGLTAIESMMLGKPVLNSGVGGLRDIFSSNQFLICGNTEEYIEKTRFLLSNIENTNISYKIIELSDYTKMLQEIYK